MTKDEILGALPALTRTELETVHALTCHLLGALMGASAGLPPEQASIFEALVTALGASISYASIAHTQTGKLFIKRLPDFEKFLDVNFRGWNSHKVTQLAFLRMIFTLIKDDLQKRDVTPSVGMIVSNMIRIRDVFEQAFPGYLSGGMGEVILKRFK